MRRRARPLARMPRLETSLFTMGVAAYLLMLVRLERGDAAAAEGAPIMDGRRMYELADAAGALISPVTGKACAGSPRLIVEYFDVLLDGTCAPPASSEAWQALGRLGDLDRFHAYAAASARLEMLVKLAQALYAHTLLGLAPHALPEEAGPLRAALAQCHYRRGVALDDVTHARRAAASALALLDEWPRSTPLTDVRSELRAAGLVDADGLPQDHPTTGPEARRRAATRLVGTTLLLQARAACEQRAAHAALGRFEGHAIEPEAFAQRCGGTALQQLLARLHHPLSSGQTAAAQPAVAAAVPAGCGGAVPWPLIGRGQPARSLNRCRP